MQKYTSKFELKCAPIRDSTLMNWQHKEKRQHAKETKKLYDVVRKISGTYQQCNKPIRDRHGTILTTHDAQLKRWNEYFDQLLNQPEPAIRRDIPAAQSELQIDTSPPSRGEIAKAICLLNNGKAPGSVDILEVLL